MTSKKQPDKPETKKDSALGRYGDITANKDPDIHVFPEGLHFGKQLWFYKSEKDRAVNIARQYISFLPEERRETLKQYLISLFELWKIENGIPSKPPSDRTKRKGAFSILLGSYAIDDYEEEERRTLIEDMKPWETAPFYVSSPLELFHHIHSTKFRNLPQGQYGYLLATTIIYSDEQGQKSFWPDMIKEALWLAEQEIKTLDSFTKNLFEKNKKLRKSNFSRTKGLISNNEIQKHQAERKKKTIHQAASQYLGQGKAPRNIPSLIEKHGGLGIKYRQIKNHLEDHPSGHWKTKSKKKN